MAKIFKFTLTFALTLLVSGCATILNTTTQEVEIKSNPPNAKITIDNKKFGVTPQIVNIERKKDHTIKFELEGYQLYEIQVTTKLSGWIWLNILNGFIPGMAIDYLTGSLNRLYPDILEVQLIPVPAAKEQISQ